MSDPLAFDVHAIVEPLSQALLPYLDRPFALFGHSMGALICFELARKLASSHGVRPAQLMVSGWRSPDLIDPRKDYDLGDAEFVSMLRNLNGTPEEILDNPEALELMLPILRADFHITQDYRFTDGERLTCPIRAYGGAEDRSVTPDLIRRWKNLTTGPFSMSL